MQNALEDEIFPAETRLGRSRIVFPSVLLLFCGVLLLSFKQALTLPFLNDDYLILEKVIPRNLLSIWLPEQLLFNWYRPWSRELHYWVLVRLFGPHEPGFHVASFALWLADMLLYFWLLRRLRAPAVTAAFATLCAASLALWSAPLLWIAGVQELWLIALALSFLLALSYERIGLAGVILVPALLSKEVAGVLPLVGLLQLLLLQKVSRRKALIAFGAFAFIVAFWGFVHPTLRERVFGHLQVSLETTNRPTLPMTVVKTVLAQFNLDAVPHPEGGWERVLPRALLLSVAGIVAAYLLGITKESPEQGPSDLRRRHLLFGLGWAAAGWSILLLPSIGWHSYYGALGSLGFWFAMTTALSSHRRIAVAVLALLLFVREARLETPSWDWGAYWYQRRAGSFLNAIRTEMLGLYPTLPHHSRLYFANLPNNIGVVTADGPAFRIWYGDSTLTAGFYSMYAPRSAGTSEGRDYFFRYDVEHGLTEVFPGPEPKGRDLGPLWEHNQRVLASLFLRSGDLPASARVYAKLWYYRQLDLDYALSAAGLYAAMGDSVEAKKYIDALTKAGKGEDARRALPYLIADARKYASGTQLSGAPTR